ncbi:hypothetical protein LguiA_014663 [Lonicera macranthoides]
MDSQTHPLPCETEIPAQTNPETETEFNQRNESSSESDHGGGVEALVGTSKPRGGNKRKPSIVWSYVTKKEFKNEFGDTDTVAICNVCKIEIPANSKRNGTTGIRNHLEKCEGSGLYKQHDSSQPKLTQESFGGAVVPFLGTEAVEMATKTKRTTMEDNINKVTATAFLEEFSRRRMAKRLRVGLVGNQATKMQKGVTTPLRSDEEISVAALAALASSASFDPSTPLGPAPNTCPQEMPPFNSQTSDPEDKLEFLPADEDFKAATINILSTFLELNKVIHCLVYKTENAEDEAKQLVAASEERSEKTKGEIEKKGFEAGQASCSSDLEIARAEARGATKRAELAEKRAEKAEAMKAYFLSELNSTEQSLMRSRTSCSEWQGRCAEAEKLLGEAKNEAEGWKMKFLNLEDRLEQN